MSTSLVIPENINDLSPIEQVLLFHDAGASVFAIDPPGTRKSNGKTLNKPPGKKRPSLPERDEVYHQFGNGNDFNAGVYPPEGYMVVNLDAADKDRGRVDRFLDSTPSLADVPRVQTARGYHLYFRSDVPPSTIIKPSIVPQVNFHVITSEKYVVVPPSRHAEGLRYIWKRTGEPPVWTPEIATAFNLPPEEQPEPPTQEPQTAENRAEFNGTFGARALSLPLPGADREELVLSWMGSSHHIARKVFRKLAKTNRYFIREGNLVCYDPTSTSGRLVEISADELRSRLDKHFQVRRPIRKDQPQRLIPDTATADEARLLLGSQEMREELKEVGRVMRHPVLVSENGEPKILITGAHEGLFIDSNDVIPDIPISEAVTSILGLLEDFKFRTESDKSRAVSHFLSPALVFGSLLSGRVPFHVVEADKPGSGKGFLQKLITTIYNEAPGVIINIKKGIGSTDGTLSRRLLDGCAFIQYDNYRGRLDSEMQESALTEDKAPCRALHTEGEVSTKGAFFMMTSNGAELTEDLSDRSCFVRIIKQDEDYKWVWEGDELLVHVKDKWSYYLGCIYSVLSEWIRRGKPSTTAVNLHRFRSWAGSMDWIVRNLFGLKPLLDGHKEVQKTVASPILVFLRQAAIHLKKEGRIGEELKALDLIQLAQNHDLSIQGIKDLSDERAHQVLGSKLFPLFKASNTLKLDESFMVIRKEENVKRDSGGAYERKHYVFFEITPPPQYPSAPPTAPPTAPGSGDPKSGPGESLPSPTTQELAKNDHITSGFTPDPQYSAPPPHHLPNQGYCGGLDPQHQGLAEHHRSTAVHNTVLVQYNTSGGENEKSCVGGGNSRDPYCGTAETDDMPSLVIPVASPSGGDMSFSLKRKKSELDAVAETLDAISEPLAIDLKTYDRHNRGPQHLTYDNEIRLLSIKAPGLPPWVIDLKETGYDLGELKNVLQNHELIMDDAKSTVRLLWTNLQIELKQAWCISTARHILNYATETAGFRIPFALARFLADEPRDPGTCTDKFGHEHNKTNWREPLTESHYQFAAASVECLVPLKTLLEQALVESQMLPTFQYENFNSAIRPSPTSFVQRPSTNLGNQ